jgi:hypothetical protein
MDESRFHWKLENEELERQAVAIFQAVKTSLEESGDYLDMLAAIRRELTKQHGQPC